MEILFVVLLVAVVVLAVLASPKALNNINTTLVRDPMCDAFVDAIDGGSPPGLLEFHTAAFAAKLGTCTFANPAYGASSSGTAQENPIVDDASADATGTLALCRVTTGTPATLWEGTAGAGSEDIVFNSAAFVIGDTISVTDLPATMPAA